MADPIAPGTTYVDTQAGTLYTALRDGTWQSAERRPFSVQARVDNDRYAFRMGYASNASPEVELGSLLVPPAPYARIVSVDAAIAWHSDGAGKTTRVNSTTTTITRDVRLADGRTLTGRVGEATREPCWPDGGGADVSTYDRLPAGASATYRLIGHCNGIEPRSTGVCTVKVEDTEPGTFLRATAYPDQGSTT
ncbi:hypothetical protein [Streptomyces sp. UNOB3_S3]|uniref:hypothetical protein n=1 Tax=Streptomyces sp. UNOB3_S3 TaxID=2871682 RepID=UPI001E39A7D4|nr:hypothetical protein [Streptomyces sp. UNOB3_S3]MCC3773494.1 hypothetical protein [Streptomyces sp. UNOB3_S3]